MTVYDQALSAGWLLSALKEQQCRDCHGHELLCEFEQWLQARSPGGNNWRSIATIRD